MKSKLPACFCISAAFFEITTSSAPRRTASAVLFGDVVNSTTCAPKAWANFTPMWPKSAEADDADLLPFADFPVAQRRIGGDAGAQQRRGAGGIQLVGHAQHEGFVDDDAVGIAAVGDAAENFVRRCCR